MVNKNHRNKKLTQRQYDFCLQYMKTKSPGEAYRRAYSAEKMNKASVKRKANRMMKLPHVAAKINDLQYRQLARSDVTIDNLTEELNEDRGLARRLDQPAAAITAVMGKAKLHGFLKDRQEVTGADGKPLIPEKPLTVEDAIKLIKALKARG